ncbi:MAG: aminotransferase class V-fold PLP-dependent enzyme [Betaproteobacteria bacterium]
MIDLERIRSETGVTQDRIYVNNARMSPPARPVLDAVKAIHERAWREGWVGLDQPGIMAGARAAVADLIGARATEIAITQSASYSINLIANGLDWRSGENIVMTELAYRSVAMSLLRVSKERGLELRVVPAPDLLLRPEDFSRYLDRKTRLVVSTMQPMFCGVPQPVAEIGQVVREHSDALYCINATQTVGQRPIDVQAFNCDFLFGTARKWLRGPRGLGFLYVREALIPELRPTYIGYPAALWTSPQSYTEVETIDRLHLGDYPYPSLVELTTAIRYAMSVGVENIYQRNQYLGKTARLALKEVPGVEIYDLTHGVMGTVPLNVHGVPAETAVMKLAERGIIACVAYEENALLALRKIGQCELIRISLHYYNTEEDIDCLAMALGEIAIEGPR